MEKTKKRLICLDCDHAVKYGVHQAILINYFQYYITKNIECDLSGIRKKQDRSFREGRTYSYISKENLAEYFPFFTESKVKTALNKLKKKGVLITGRFNKKGYDRTLWYAFNNEEEFLELPAQYKEFLRAQGADSLIISDIKSKTDELSSISCKSSSDKSDRRSKSEPAKKPMDDTILTNPMDISPQSIGEISPTIPNNTTIIQYFKKNTYLPMDDEMDDIDFNMRFIDDSEAYTTNDKFPDETDIDIGRNIVKSGSPDKVSNSDSVKVGKESFSAASGSSHDSEAYLTNDKLPVKIDIDSERKNVKSDSAHVVSNSNSSKVGNESYSAASGSSHNVDILCSITDLIKLRQLFKQHKDETGDNLANVEKWYDWVLTKQDNPNEIKHGSAWIKSYLKFVERNAVYEQAEAHEVNRKKQELIDSQRLNDNPYNDMRK